MPTWYEATPIFQQTEKAMTAPKKAPIPEDQKLFRHSNNFALERFAVKLLGKRYHKSMDRVDIGHWKTVYVKTFEVLNASVFSSVGAVDKEHRVKIEAVISQGLEALREAKGKDHLHGVLIASLLNLVFLLLGREPYYAKGPHRSFAVHRTLTYSQTEEQLSWLLQGYIQRHANNHGFGDFFDADYAFYTWAKLNKKQRSDRSAYVCWVREHFPQTYALFA
jgi:hypothetical protein